MFRTIRYVLLLLGVLLCLFVLQKNKANIQAGFAAVMDGISILFNATTTTHGDVYDQINGHDFIGGLGTTTKNIEIKSFSEASIGPKPSSPKISIDGIIYYTNLEREKAGLAPLKKSTKLNTSASLKTDDMFTNQYFEHVSPDNKTAADVVKSVGYDFQIVGENLALGVFDTDKALVQAWMNSPTHRANILNPKYTEIGASVGIGDYKGHTEWIAVQHFAKPMPACTPINTSTQDKIDAEKAALETKEKELQIMAGVIEADPAGNTATKEYINNYNQQVNEYNVRLNALRDRITDFNKTIVSYNDCVKG